MIALVTLHTWAVQDGSARGQFYYWHVGAARADLEEVWEAAKQTTPRILTGLSWSEDHFIVWPSPLFSAQHASMLEDRYAKAIAFLNEYFARKASAKTLIDELPVTVDGVPAREVL